MYRSELINIKTWRVSPAVIRFSKRYLLPLIGSTRPPRRLNLARPERRQELVNDEVVTTARSPVSTTHTDGAPSQAQGEAGSVVREWVNELRGRTEDPARIRTPSDAEIDQLAAMFPDISRELITRALQRTCVQNQSNSNPDADATLLGQTSRLPLRSFCMSDDRK